MDDLQKLVIVIELHAPEGIKRSFENGISPNQLYKDKPLIEELTSEYTRTSRFKDCVKVFVDYNLRTFRKGSYNSYVIAAFVTNRPNADTSK